MLFWGLVFIYDDKNNICCLMYDEYIIRVIFDFENM